MGDLTEFINRDHLLRAIISYAGRTDVQLSEGMEVKRATAGVEGFLSLVLRVKVPYRTGEEETRSKTFIVKCLPREDIQLNIVKVTNVFAREGMFYDNVLPLMRKVAAGRLDIAIPRCYHVVHDGAEDAIYLEDLSETSFSTVGRQLLREGLDREHGSIIAKKMGILHALGFAAERALPPGSKTWPDAFPVFGEEPLYYNQKPGDPPVPFKGVADTGNEIVVEVAGNMDGLPKEAADSGKLKEIIDRFWPIVCELAKPDRRSRNVLCHGDCWVNNMMFKYEVDPKCSKRPVDMKFIDLQNVKYCHPCIDLLYLFHLNTRRSFREKYYDEIISEYYGSLQESLKTLDFGPPPFTLEEFASDLKMYKPFAVYFGAVYTPCMLLDEDFAPKNAEDMTPETFEELINSGNVSAIRLRLASDPVYVSHVEDVVREFVEMVFPNGSVDSSPFLKE